MLHSNSMCPAGRSFKVLAATLAVICLTSLTACGSSVAPVVGSGNAPVVQPADGSPVGNKHCAPMPGTATLAEACVQTLSGKRT
ncbi:hypothetical protein E4T66_07930 [Sinimarinibacterium sp. CAU 1509]|uniref:hypothetical protein n=1 Tax=Sinimarinibacterium sp. CAU 1509 TaxID=2562283 RepID=UPI0010ACFE21|nr:hypothetical protein [Sinimarinibacterium sp. CAU 1509]TJY62148.1 hypothetical protein E4T66_07930 [Sinimarinibacterium sp. CAU 1509]